MGDAKKPRAIASVETPKSLPLLNGSFESEDWGEKYFVRARIADGYIEKYTDDYSMQEVAALEHVHVHLSPGKLGISHCDGEWTVFLDSLSRDERLWRHFFWELSAIHILRETGYSENFETTDLV